MSAILEINTNSNVPEKLTTIQMLRKYGISRNELHHQMLNSFVLPEDSVEAMKQYFILHWTGAEFARRISEGMIATNSHSFQVVYQNCTPARVKKAELVRISCRKAQPEIYLPAYAIVQIGKKLEKLDPKWQQIMEGA